ncbi:hypothetical protein J2755_002204 [Methanohalophilus levihalophilus]|uniref:PEF-CTERM sorting domain-containing protein n=1 Tax=Methanohalophilus levihalophilus TaxID=1431282 RepID=UPI001AE27973|nr:PEF-CTERM sorting domain-containing protein [Methanohalophilus levihalophilus]MBP2031241.1 hypothetical protein [Methanohalophilus levihalophilus]
MKAKVLVAILAVFLLSAGTAAAYDANLWNADGSAALPNPIIIQPGENITASFLMENLLANDLNETFYYDYTVVVVSGSGVPSDITVTTPVSVVPTTSPYMDVGVIKIEKDANAPMDTVYRVQVEAGGEGTEIDTASRTINVPEFPTVALPIAAILGLAFFIQRRRDE